MSEPRQRAGAPEHMPLLADAVQDTLNAEHFLHKCTRELTRDPLLAEDAQWATVANRLHALAVNHIGDIETLLEQIGRQPSAIRVVVGSGLGQAMGFMEKLTDRNLIHVSRHVYAVLAYTAGSYHALYTLAVLLERPAAAGVALRHLRDYTPEIRELGQLLSWSQALALPTHLWQGKGVMDVVLSTLAEAAGADPRQ